MKVNGQGEVILSTEEFTNAVNAIYEGLNTDGDHHKQFYLAEVARALSIDLGAFHEGDLGVPG